MVRHMLMSVMVVVVFSALLAVSAPSAHAIPIAGDYTFTSGLIGTFTSNGNELTAWDITDPFGVSYVGTSPTDSDFNEPQIFRDYQLSPFYVFTIRWDPNSSVSFQSTALTASHTTILDVRRGQAFYEPAPAGVPEPSSGLLVLAGLFVLLVHGVRRSYRTGAQIG